MRTLNLPVWEALVEDDRQDDILGQVCQVDYTGLRGNVRAEVKAAKCRRVPRDAMQRPKGYQLQQRHSRQRGTKVECHFLSVLH